MKNKRFYLWFILVMSVFFSLPETLYAQIAYYIEQGEFSLDLSVVEDTKTDTAFYSYNTPAASSANTGLEIAEVSQLFLYRNLNTSDGQLSLFIIHDKPSNSGGGSAKFSIGPVDSSDTGLPPNAKLSVSDDSGEFTVSTPNASGNWTWSSCCTDGGVIGGLQNTEFAFWITPTANFTSINKWQWRVGSGSGDLVDIPSLNTPIRVVAATDTDQDGIADTRDNCPELANENQSDIDQDGFGDDCDCAPEDPNRAETCLPCASSILNLPHPSFALFFWMPALACAFLFRNRK